MRRFALATALTVAALVGPMAAVASAQETGLTEVIEATDKLWIVVAAILVMFMQAGFALVESGFTRAKNAANIVMKNFMDFSVGALVYWVVGFGLAYGGSTIGGLFATGEFFFSNQDRAHEWFFQAVFAATAATIISGAVAERVKFTGYLLYTPFITGLIYPIVTHWVWSGDGWLTSLGFVDFAGSGVVHMLGGIAALAGVMVVGPRIGKYDENGRPRTIPGHSLTLGALGVFILWFGWYGFNGGSTLAAVGADFASVMVTTTLAPSAGAVAAMFVAWLVLGKPDVGLAINGALAGLVGITAGADSLSFGAAVLVGLMAGAMVVGSIIILERLGIDDPVGAISVHGTVGAWGVLAVGLLSTDGGLLTGGGGALLVSQVVGILAIAGWTFVTSYSVFKVIDLMHGLRVGPAEERAGLDRTEHGGEAYPEFVFQEQIAPPSTLDPVGSNGDH